MTPNTHMILPEKMIDNIVHYCSLNRHKIRYTEKRNIGTFYNPEKETVEEDKRRLLIIF